jgi:hypothetical protein
MFGYIYGLFCGFLSGTVFGYSLNFILKTYRRYKITKDPQKIIIEELYKHITNKVFENCYDNIEVFVNDNIGTIIKQIPDISELIHLSNNLIELSKHYNNKFTIVYDNKTDKTIKIKLIENNILENKTFIDTLTFLNKNKIELCIIKNEENEEKKKIT